MFVLDNLFKILITYQFKGGLAETGQEACYKMISSKDSPWGIQGGGRGLLQFLWRGGILLVNFIFMCFI